VVLIISDKSDLQVYYVMVELEELGVDYGLFNAADYPTRAFVSQSFESRGDSCSIGLEGGAVVHSAEVEAVWYRKPDVPQLHPKVSGYERQFSFNECQAGLRGMYHALDHAYWISRLDNIRAASNKLRQLRCASRLGFEVPQTLFTNDASEARAFLAALPSSVIYKSIGDTALVERDGPWDNGSVIGELFTTLLDEETLEAGLERLTACPALFQEYVEKEVELRITVVGGSVFGAELHSQAQPATHIDWRRGTPLEIEHRVHDLPADLRSKCLELVRTFGLEFAAIDMVKAPDGRYVFLELNPNGQYGWIEAQTPLQISKAIARRLAAARTEIAV
jgi:glutathione synthase/RimK-type ligase-like ATP-grasp enzyme